MENQKCPFVIGEKVIFDPDEHTYGWRASSFDRLKIYPGKLLIIKEIENFGSKGDFIMVKNDDGGWFHCHNFIKFNPDEKCPFKVGDKVRFTPSQRTINRWSFDIGPKPGKVYLVKKITNDIWVFVSQQIPSMWIFLGRDTHGYYWKDYTFIKHKS
jgi:hypothetical protein